MRLIAVLALACLCTRVAHADSVVNLCNTDNEAGAGTNLRAAIAVGGRVTFACPSGTVMRVAQTQTINNATEVDGGNTVTLDGAHAVPSVFQVTNTPNGTTIAIRNIVIRGGGNAPANPIFAGAIDVNFSDSTSRLIFDHVTVTDTVHPVDVGRGTFDVSNSTFNGNSGLVIEVGHPLDASTLNVSDTQFEQNSGQAFQTLRCNVTLKHISVSGVAGQGGKAGQMAEAGSVFNDGVLAIRNSSFANVWSVSTFGGALESSSKTLIANSTFTNNRSKFGGGAVALRDSMPQASLRALTFENNRSSGRGGALSIEGVTAQVDLRYSEFRNNTADYGGAVSVYAGSGTRSALSVGAVSFKGNEAAVDGGAMYASGAQLTLTRVVAVDNRAPAGAVFFIDPASPVPVALGNLLVARSTAKAAVSASAGSFFNATIADNSGIGLQASGHVRLVNSVLSKNGAHNCEATGAGAVDDGGSNRQFPDSSCGPGIPAVDPMLDNFYVPDPSSPLQQSGQNKACLDSPVSARDVYGQRRPRSVTCTIGAVEGDIDQTIHHVGIIGPGPEPVPGGGGGGGGGGGRGGGGVGGGGNWRNCFLLIFWVMLILGLLIAVVAWLRRRRHHRHTHP